ncbi:DUF1499 domain-containing protein [Thalassobacillus sp. CUG 92003]|uniref:DUF1499 domain-containing protein n=1 Tax=Thalassobacillus sp. CUG 92003 TaxID=2736641 RepID=UPI0015E75D8D|nr:DUF1499 domain-containing protein [Thalassobacillus sp. CUG 92003]
MSNQSCKNRLAACPTSPNCVSTLEMEEHKKKMMPLPFIGGLDQTKEAVKTIIKKWLRRPS